jgi:hypothetical protein
MFPKDLLATACIDSKIFLVTFRFLMMKHKKGKKVMRDNENDSFPR